MVYVYPDHALHLPNTPFAGYEEGININVARRRGPGCCPGLLSFRGGRGGARLVIHFILPRRVGESKNNVSQSSLTMDSIASTSCFPRFGYPTKEPSNHELNFPAGVAG